MEQVEEDKQWLADDESLTANWGRLGAHRNGLAKNATKIKHKMLQGPRILEMKRMAVMLVLERSRISEQ